MLAVIGKALLGLVFFGLIGPLAIYQIKSFQKMSSEFKGLKNFENLKSELKAFFKQAQILTDMYHLTKSAS